MKFLSFLAFYVVRVAGNDGIVGTRRFFIVVSPGRLMRSDRDVEYKLNGNHKWLYAVQKTNSLGKKKIAIQLLLLIS